MIKIRHFRIPQYLEDFVSDIPKRERRKPSNDLLVPYSRHDRPFFPMTKGGRTQVIYCEPDAEQPVVFVDAIANCSLMDNFNYSRGRRIAAGRLDKLLAETYGMHPDHPDREKLKEMMK